MPVIYAIGETIYDIIFKNEEPVAAKAGGAMLNTAVSLGRLGLPVHLISEYATDRVGDIINKFLDVNGVDTSYVFRYQDGKTPVALAFLNDQADARYSFYKFYPENRLEIEHPAFTAGDIIIFGGFYSLMPEIRQQLMSFLKASQDSGATILYDPNIRSPHKDEIGELRELIYENLSLSNIVRGSDEDFKTVFGIEKGHEAYRLLQECRCHYLVYTKSNKGVEIHSPGGMMEVAVPPVQTVSTVGAGDSFNAGLIYELFRKKKKPGDYSMSEFSEMIKTAMSFGSHVCTHYDNYISEGFAEKMMLDTGY